MLDVKADRAGDADIELCVVRPENVNLDEQTKRNIFEDNHRVPNLRPSNDTKGVDVLAPSCASTADDDNFEGDVIKFSIGGGLFIE